MTTQGWLDEAGDGDRLEDLDDVSARGAVDEAAQAFEELRREVAQHGAAVQALSQALLAQKAPDYSEDLGQLTLQVKAASEQVKAMAAHPSHRLTPEQYATVMVNAGKRIGEDAAQRLQAATEDLIRERAQLGRLVGLVQAQRWTRKALWGGGVAAFLLGMVMMPFLARALPFGLDGWVAAGVMGGNRWEAGFALMRQGSATGWQSVVDGAHLIEVNQEAILACRQLAAKTKKEQRCMINVVVPNSLIKSP